MLHASFEAGTDGDDYIEAGGGSDVVFGGLGQDDIIGGSSELFTLDQRAERPDGADLLFGGAGTQVGRNDDTGSGEAFYDRRHARDADTIVGDNGDIYRLVGINNVDTGTASAPYLRFNYDNPSLIGLGYLAGLAIVARAVTLLDYTPGGPDFKPSLTQAGSTAACINGVAATNDIGGADEVHGESGDDTVYTGCGDDRILGDAEDDDLIAGWGDDWASGGTGQDGILGDDGRIFTSRNTTTGEPLYGVTGFNNDSTPDATDDLNYVIYSPGHIQEATINVTNALKKTFDITPTRSSAARRSSSTSTSRRTTGTCSASGRTSPASSPTTTRSSRACA